MILNSKNLPTKKFSPKELKNWKEHIFEIYKKMENKSKKKYLVKYGGLEIWVIPGVYAPEFFDDTLYFAEELSKIVKKKSLLEVGTGTGYIGLYCAKKGATTTLLDFNRLCVKNTILNKKKLNLKSVTIKFSNVYSSLSKKDKFDFIFWSHPFNSWDIKTSDKLLLSGIDPNYKSLDKYISQAKKYLTPDGRLLLGTGNSADLRLIYKIARKNNYKLKLLAQSERELEKGVSKSLINDLLIEFIKI